MSYKLKFLQANTNRSSSSTESILQLAVELNIDLIAVQEPWIIQEPNIEPRSIIHQSFNQILPPLGLNNPLRPRVLFYFSKDLKAQISLSEIQEPDPDFLVIKVKTTGTEFLVINLYNERDQSGSDLKTIERRLFSFPISPKTIILGDFNTKHPWWDPLAPTISPKARELVEWIEEQEIELLNNPGEGTFFRPHLARESVLDLTLASRNFASKISDWQVLPNAGSDHHPILFLVELQEEEEIPSNSTRFNIKRADWELFSKEFKKEISLNSILNNLPLVLPSKEISLSLVKGENSELEELLDKISLDFTSAISIAARASIPIYKPGPKRKAWWTSELTDLRKSLATKQRAFKRNKSQSDFYLWENEYLLARNSYLQAIKQAKKDHWNNFLENETPVSIFKALAYTKSSTSQNIPSIRSSTQLEDTFLGKCRAFRKAFYPPPPTTSPPCWENYISNRNIIEWPQLTRAELELACSSKIKSKTPGPDGITQEIIIAAYKEDPELFFKVYSYLFNLGYHPICWKQATGAILKKNSKPDYSVPKAYRVISLLNCLGKVLERIIAKRLSSLAETQGFLHHTQIGGRFQKSAVDACLLQYNYIQENKNLGRITSTAFIDIKGAFDHVAINQLLRVQASYLFPISCIAWTNSFLKKRSLRLAFNGQLEEFSEITSGVPQGSPVSPILFLIYISRICSSSLRFSLSYIDDLSISTASTSLKKNTRLLEKAIIDIFTLGQESQILFDKEKIDLIHFTTSKKAKDFSITLPNGTVIAPKTNIRWLGVYFNSSLSFKEHVAIRISQARSTFYRMARLANCSKGLSPFAIRQLYIACIASVADYGMQVIWKGQKNFQKQFQTLQNLGVRKILGAFRTSPIIPIEIEATLPPPAIRLDNLIRQYAFRARKLPSSHPINKAISPFWVPKENPYIFEHSSSPPRRKYAPTQIELIAKSIAPKLSSLDEKIIAFSFPPWKKETPYKTIISPLSKEKETIAHNQDLSNRIGENLLVFYTDASSIPDGTGIGVSFTGYDYSQNAQQIISSTYNLGKGHIVYNGELEGIVRALEYASSIALFNQQIRIYADNQAAILRLRTPSDNPGQQWQIRAIKAANIIKEKGATSSIYWVPGHKDIIGNEEADSLAKRAAKEPPISNSISLALIGLRIREIGKLDWIQYAKLYNSKAVRRNPNTYTRKYPIKISRKLAIPQGTKREIASTFYQLKLGHGYNRDYLYKFGKVPSPNCSCGQKQSPEHLLLRCKNLRIERKALQEELGNPLSLPLLLHTKIGIKATCSFIEKTKVATRKWHLNLLEEEEEES